MSLHTNSLFHFTKKEHLIGILENNFVPHYCKERLTIENINYDYWLPLVSFCDIPLSQVKNHIEEYGKYAIGLNREWVNKNKLNPVLYYKEKSLLFENYYELRSSIQNKVNKIDCDNTLLDNYNKIKYLFAFFKPYEGYDFKLQREKVFYDEREWRFVPETKDNNYIFLDKIITQRRMNR